MTEVLAMDLTSRIEYSKLQNQRIPPIEGGVALGDTDKSNCTNQISHANWNDYQLGNRLSLSTLCTGVADCNDARRVEVLSDVPAYHEHRVKRTSSAKQRQWLIQSPSILSTHNDQQSLAIPMRRSETYIGPSILRESRVEEGKRAADRPSGVEIIIAIDILHVTTTLYYNLYAAAPPHFEASAISNGRSSRRSKVSDGSFSSYCTGPTRLRYRTLSSPVRDVTICYL